jgi:iron complex outermembrane recepter protein
MDTWKRSARNPMSAFFLVSLLAMAVPLPAAAQEVHDFNVSAADPATAIGAFGVQAGIQILASADDLKGKQFNSIKGNYSTEDALNDLLAGTGLQHHYVGDRAVALVASSASTAQPSGSASPMNSAPVSAAIAGSTSQEPKSNLWSRLHLAQVDQGGTPSDASIEKQTPSTSAQLQEIVITAEKRVETVQSTPLSVTAYTGADLLAQGLTDLSAVGYETAGVSERNSGPGQTEYNIRGIASSAGESATVGFYLDDIPLSAPDQSLLGKVVVDPSLYDLNRVEVLRGPQGTLYGSGSMGGTIKLVTNQPDPNHFSASAETIGSGTQDGGFNYGVNAMVNLPLIADTLALRIVGTDTYTDGWIDRKVLNPFPLEGNDGTTRGDVLAAPVAKTYTDSNWTRLQGGRATLQWTPIDGLTISPSMFFQRVTQGAPNFVDSPPGVQYETHYQPFDVSEPYSDSFQLFSLPIKYHAGDIDLTAVTAYYHRETHLTQDSSEIAQDFLEKVIGVPNVPFSAVGPIAFSEVDHGRQLTEEVRVNSSGAGPFQWLVGGFYQDFKPDTDLASNTPGPIFDELFGAPSTVSATFQDDIKQYAGFGEASYNLPENLKFTAGLRYYKFDIKEDTCNWGALVGIPANAPFCLNLPASASGVNPRFNLSYEPTGDLTLYTQIAKGFRPGGANIPWPPPCLPTPSQFDPDSIWSYEAGEKTRLFDRRLTLNGAVYFENWTGIQQVVTPACGATYVANAGTAHVYGSELEADAALTPELTLTNSAGYVHAFIAEAAAGSGFVTGEAVQEVPRWTDTTSLVYKHPVTPDHSLVLRATNVYTDSMTDTSYVLNVVPPRDIVNLRAGWVSEKNLSISLFVNNATDKRADLGDPEEVFVFVPVLNRVMTNQPRTIGLDLTYAWGE